MKKQSNAVPNALVALVQKAFPGNPMSKRRLRPNVDARTAVACQLKERGFTYQQIGDFFGLNHSSVVYMLKQHQNLIELNNNYRKSYSSFLDVLSNENTSKEVTEGEVLENVLTAAERLYFNGMSPNKIKEVFCRCIDNHFND